MYSSLNNSTNERNYDLEKMSVNKVLFIHLVLSRQIFILKDANCPSIFREMGSFIVIVTGNPRVIRGYPYPYPVEPVPAPKGKGFDGSG